MSMDLIRNLFSEATPQPYAVSFKTYSSIIDYASNNTANVHLVICSSKEDFIHTLLTEFDHGNLSSALLPIPSIHLISRSPKVHFTFVADHMHLCGHMGTMTAGPKLTDEATEGELLIVVDMLQSLREADKLNGQILMKTCALSIDAAAASCRQLLFLERSHPSHEEFDMTDEELQTIMTNKETDVWSEEIPVLQGRVRLGNDFAELSSRKTQVGEIFRRWCTLIPIDELIAL